MNFPPMARWLLVGLLIGLVPGSVLGGTLLREIIPHDKVPSATASLLSGEFIIPARVSDYFAVSLTPEKPVHVKLILLEGNFTSGIDLYLTSPQSIDVVSATEQTSYETDLTPSTPDFVAGVYSVDIVNIARMDARIFLEISFLS